MQTNEYEKVDLPLMWNVVDSATYQARAKVVFNQVASVLKNTLGPYGTTTILERAGDNHFTKDGWNVLKNIHFSDRIEESILQLIINIASQVVTRVGDGSTSSVVASSELYDNLSPIIGKERPKDIIRRLNKAVETITERIESNATIIDKDDKTYQDIYRVALISTNGDEEVASIIQKIYQLTNNPDIEYRIGRSGTHEYKVIDGYQSGITALDEIFLNNPDEGIGEYSDIITLLFDHRINQSTHIEFLNEALIEANRTGKPLYIAAHGYDSKMLDWLRDVTNRAVRSNQSFGIIAGYAKLLNSNDRHMYGDLATLTGGRVVTDNVIEQFNKMEYKAIEGTDESELVRSNPDITASDFIGYVENITVGRDTTIFTGFPKVNDQLLEVQVRDARAKLAELDEREESYGVVGHEINQARERVSRLTCSVGVFLVGGHSSIARNAEKDLIEDAIKATASAYKFGYNLGNNLSIIKAVDELIKEGSLDELDVQIYKLISKSFSNVITEVYNNWDEEKVENGIVDNIIEHALATGETFDIIKEEYGNEIINPTRTDIEILHGAISIISMIISSNQYVASTPEFIVTK